MSRFRSGFIVADDASQPGVPELSGWLPRRTDLFELARRDTRVFFQATYGVDSGAEGERMKDGNLSEKTMDGSFIVPALTIRTPMPSGAAIPAREGHEGRFAFPGAVQALERGMNL